MIPPLKVGDAAQQALNWMEKFRLSQLPVINADVSYMGLISENTILESGDTDKKISELQLDFADLYASPNTHFYDVIKMAIKNRLQVVAVVGADKKFAGVISVNDTTSAMAQMFASQGAGGIIVLSMAERDYSLAEISRHAEGNDIKILSAFVVEDDQDSSMIKVTLKLNRSDLSRLVATFERYNYKIIAKFQETELLSNDKERLDLLLKYLSI
ncbi:MAG: CBS domain-containing protein [Cytophagaceae bacterium]